jgi:hypothetical protein
MAKRTTLTIGGTTYILGQRLATRPHTDVWMQGDRYGTVEFLGRTKIGLRMDRSGRLLHFRATSLDVVDDQAGWRCRNCGEIRMDVPGQVCGECAPELTTCTCSHPFEYHWDGGAGRCAAAECACTSFQA